MNTAVTDKTYDAHVQAQGLQFQIDTYYEPKDEPMRRRIQVVMDALDPAPGERILDVGCGVGTFAFHAARAGAQATGIDYSSASIEAARILTERLGVRGSARFVTGNALSLPFAHAQFDKVVAADFIEHITDDEKLILCREIERVVKPGGRIVIFTPNLHRERAGEMYWRIRRSLFGHAVPTTDLHYGLITRARFERMLRASNWTFSLRYVDIGRPMLSCIPFIRDLLALDLLWTARAPRGKAPA